MPHRRAGGETNQHNGEEESLFKQMMHQYHKNNPYTVRLKQRELLTKGSSTKRTFHICLDLQGPGFVFKPGDAIGLFPENADEEVDLVLSRFTVLPERVIQHPRTKRSMTLRDFLKKEVSFSRLSKVFGAPPTWDFIAFCEQMEGKIDFDLFLANFFPLLPRFYSIASSLSKYPDEIHLLVDEVTYGVEGMPRKGVASQFLCHLLPEGGEIRCFPLYNPHFSLPQDPAIPIIMIGPGTGVAPYRAFLHERENASGGNWLFFGERNRASDFFYEDYFTHLATQGKLILSTAFSRDQMEKIYVQHRLLESADSLWQWLQAGAHLYLCGDKHCMAKDVAQTLASIASERGIDGMEYLKMLKKAGRYSVDVY